VLAGDGRVVFRIPDQVDSRAYYDTPGLWDAATFVVVSERMPACWVAGLDSGNLKLAPREWQRTGFWEEYFDHVPAAVAEYDRLKAEILADS
jgi:hypothetical protein